MKIDVWLLSSYNGKTLFALAFPSLDELIKYVIDYYGDYETNPIEPPEDGDDLGMWLDHIASGWGVELAIDQDVIEVTQ